MVKHNEQGLQKQKELKSKNSGKSKKVWAKFTSDNNHWYPVYELHSKLELKASLQRAKIPWHFQNIYIINIFFVLIILESGGGGIKKKVAKTAKAVTPAAPEAKTSTSATKVTEKESVSRSSTPSNEKAVKHKIGKVFPAHCP